MAAYKVGICPAGGGNDTQHMGSYEPDDIDNLSVIHVAGTKGKGSTCAYAESILRHHGFKTGFYSSPHLVEARELIRINGRPITKDVFTSCFWDVYTKLLNTKDENEGTMPLYFSFMTVMEVDVVLLEVGMGGEYDYTNFVRTPVACGISSLGLDHTTQLGHTLEDITWHKAGIFKVMRDCWQYKPNKRPTFHTIHSTLSKQFSSRTSAWFYYDTSGIENALD